MADLIDRAAVLDALIKTPGVGNRALDKIRQLPTVEPIRWIPVTERLPEVNKRVLLSLTDGTVIAGYQREPDCIWQVTEKDGSKLWVYDPDAYTDDIDSLPTAKDCWFETNDYDPDGIYPSITSLITEFPGVAAWMPLPAPYKGGEQDAG